MTGGGDERASGLKILELAMPQCLKFPHGSFIGAHTETPAKMQLVSEWVLTANILAQISSVHQSLIPFNRAQRE